MFEYYKTVYNKEEESLYIDKMGEAYNIASKGKPRDETGNKQYFRAYWRTHQMSDHLPMWRQIKTDFGREYLQEKAASS